MTIVIPPTNSPDSDFEELLRQCPNRIGRGATREVFEIPGHPDKVLKAIHVAGNYCNWAEMVVYQTAGDHRKFFARVHGISWSGKFLVMERLEKATEDEVGPVRYSFPKFANDRKTSNYGKDTAGNIKLLDYAMIELGPPPEIPLPTMLD